MYNMYVWYKNSQEAMIEKHCSEKQYPNPFMEWSHYSDAEHQIYTGVNITKPTSNNGKLDITVNWKKVEEYDH